MSTTRLLGPYPVNFGVLIPGNTFNTSWSDFNPSPKNFTVTATAIPGRSGQLLAVSSLAVEIKEHVGGPGGHLDIRPTIWVQLKNVGGVAIFSCTLWLSFVEP